MTIVANIRRSVARQVAVDVAAAAAGIADWSAQWLVHTLDHHGHRTLLDAPELGPVIDHRVAPAVRPHHAIARLHRAAQAVDDRASTYLIGNGIVNSIHLTGVPPSFFDTATATNSSA